MSRGSGFGGDIIGMVLTGVVLLIIIFVFLFVILPALLKIHT